eukprot:6307332-Pyramimonas_sp.AAC.2
MDSVHEFTSRSIRVALHSFTCTVCGIVCQEALTGNFNEERFDRSYLHGNGTQMFKRCAHEAMVERFASTTKRRTKPKLTPPHLNPWLKSPHLSCLRL